MITQQITRCLVLLAVVTTVWPLSMAPSQAKSNQTSSSKHTEKSSIEGYRRQQEALSQCQKGTEGTQSVCGKEQK